MKLAACFPSEKTHSIPRPGNSHLTYRGTEQQPQIILTHTTNFRMYIFTANV